MVIYVPQRSVGGAFGEDKQDVMVMLPLSRPGENTGHVLHTESTLKDVDAAVHLLMAVVLHDTVPVHRTPFRNQERILHTKHSHIKSYRNHTECILDP